MSDGSGRSTPALLAELSAIVAELRTRGLADAAADPGGTFARWLVATLVAGDQAARGRSYDVLDAAGERVAVLLASDGAFSLRSWGFDSAAFVILSEGLGVEQVLLAPRALVQQMATREREGPVVRLEALAASEGARDLTPQARKVASGS